MPGKGFAALSEDERKQISSMGGRAAQAVGTAHKWTSEEAKAAGRKGGAAVHAKRKEEARLRGHERADRDAIDRALNGGSYCTVADLRRLWPDLPDMSDTKMTAAIHEAILRTGFAPTVTPEVTRDIAKLAAEYLMGKRRMG